MYNFQVAGLHTYFVRNRSDSAGVLVHNESGAPQWNSATAPKMADGKPFPAYWARVQSHFAVTDGGSQQGRFERQECAGGDNVGWLSFPIGGDFQSQGGDADGRPARGRTKFTAGRFSGRNGRGDFMARVIGDDA